MGNRKALAQPVTCFAPEINKLITAYCFGRTSEKERKALEVHLFECDYCWSEVQRLEAAVHALSSEPSLMRSLSAGDFVTTFGISAKIEKPFGGHFWHALISCFLYASLYPVMLLMEFAYQFDRYGKTAMKVAPAVFVWIFATSLLALAVDWRRLSQGKGHGLALSLLIFVGAAGLLFGGLSFVLPGTSITESGGASYPAQASYLKDICYSLVVIVVFVAPTFHFVVAMQRELYANRHRLALELLTGGRFGVTPRGTIYPRFWILTIGLMIMAGVSAYLTTNLLDHLQPSAYKNLFINLMYLRLILHFGLPLKCLSWYHRALDELKRECMVMEKTKLK